jgi:hypothetical protein
MNGPVDREFRSFNEEYVKRLATGVQSGLFGHRERGTELNLSGDSGRPFDDEGNRYASTGSTVTG